MDAGTRTQLVGMIVTTRPAAPASPRPSTFASLHTRNFRLFATGQFVSYTGAWVQRIAQDWLVLSISGSVTAVGITTALQFLPTLLFGLVGGAIADRYPKRRVLLAAQAGMASMAALLALLTLTHQVAVWHVFLIAFGLGIVTSVENPTRQSFVSEMVGPDQLRNAVSINASVFQLGALVGPAISGVLINAVGSGYAFAINAGSYAASTAALLMMRERELYAPPARNGRATRLRDGLRRAAGHRDVLWPTVLAGVFGMFTINLPVTLAAYAKTVFHSGASGYGLLSSAVAGGSVVGALISARRARTRLRTLVTIAATLATVQMVAALAPSEWSYCVALAALGASTLLFLTSANSTVQLAGGPLLGWIDQHFGPRTGMLLGGLIPAIATLIVALKLAHDSGSWRARSVLAARPVI